MLDVIFKMLPAAQDHVPVWQAASTTFNQSSSTRFYEAEFVSVVQRYREVRATGDVDALKKFEATREKNTLERLNWYASLAAWERAQSSSKRAAERGARDERRAAIEEKLGEIGYTPADFPRWSHEFDNMVYQPRPLTLRIWNKIRPRLIELLDEERACRARETFKRKWRTRVGELRSHYDAFLKVGGAELAWKDTLPNFENALALPCMEALLTSGSVEESLTAAQFAAIEDALKEDAEAYRARVRRDLVALLRANEGGRKGKSGVNKIANATSSQSRKRKSSGTATRASKRTRTSTSTGKGKQRAADSSSEDEEAEDSSDDASDVGEPDSSEASEAEAELALLDSHSALFRCNSCNHVLTFPVLLLHWQITHQDSPWKRACVQVVPGAGHAVPLLLDALGLPRNTGMGALVRFVAASTGPVPGASVTCSCGRFTRAPVGRIDVGYLMEHFLPYANKEAKSTVAHRMTFQRPATYKRFTY
ncbi:hypothetical protein C8Q76DRAFT_731509 [Earliella scabrosa]|nr:hypothetical protein C8Q76DRAFT_731509 [Earliella scabrosa]